MTHTLTALALLVATHSAFASSTMFFQTSVNGGAYAGGNQYARPGDQVRVRVHCRTDNPLAMGLAGISYQPTVDGWIPLSDELAPWSTPVLGTDGTTPGTNGPGVRDTVNGNGRLAPFSAPAALVSPVVFLGNPLIIGTLIGTGTSIPTGQFHAALSNNINGNYYNASSSVAVFQYTFTVGTNHGTGDVMSLGIRFPLGPTSQIKWYTTLTTTAVINEGTPAVEPGSITIVPNVGTLALLGIGATCARRRR